MTVIDERRCAVLMILIRSDSGFFLGVWIYWYHWLIDMRENTPNLGSVYHTPIRKTP
jgi:hypothetical protein